MFASLVISQFLIKVAQTRQMDFAFLTIPKIEMCRYGMQGDSRRRRHERWTVLPLSSFVDLLLNNSSFVLTINQVIPPLFHSSQKPISTSHFPPLYNLIERDFFFNLVLAISTHPNC